MHIKLAIVDSDLVYLERFTSKISSLYKSEITIESFSSVDTFFSLASHKLFDILWIDESIEVPEEYQNSEMIVYMVQNNKINSVKGKQAISKYQNVNDIYKELIDYASKLEKNFKYEFANQKTETTNTIMVTGAAGGVGTSLYSTALAMKIVEEGKRVLHVDINNFSCMSYYSDEHNDLGLDETIKLIKNYIIKGDESDISSELRTMISNDHSGVDYIKPFKSLFKSFETKSADIKELIGKLVEIKEHDYIIVEKALKIERDELSDLSDLDRIVVVSDNSSKCENNLSSIVKAIEFFDSKKKSDDQPISRKMMVAYNKMKVPKTDKSLLKILSSHRELRGKDDSEIIIELKEKLNVEGLIW